MPNNLEQPEQSSGMDAPTSTRRPVHSYVIVSLAVSLMLAACGNTDSADAAAGEGPKAEVEMAPATPDQGTGGEPGAPATSEMPVNPDGRASGMIRSPGDTTQVIARISEYRIELGQDTIGSGGISLVLRNEGERPHTIELRGADGMRWRSIPIPPGGAVTMSMLLSPGAYTVSSTTPAYVDRGMTSNLYVR